MFTAQLHSLEEVWNKRESEITKQKAVFYGWFLEHHVSTVKDSMLYGVCRSAGLGNPLPYYTNAVESMNSLLKLRTDFKKQELTVFICKLKELVENQFVEVDKAVAGIYRGLCCAERL